MKSLNSSEAVIMYMGELGMNINPFLPLSLRMIHEIPDQLGMGTATHKAPIDAREIVLPSCHLVLTFILKCSKHCMHYLEVIIMQWQGSRETQAKRQIFLCAYFLGRRYKNMIVSDIRMKRNLYSMTYYASFFSWSSTHPIRLPWNPQASPSLPQISWGYIITPPE